MYLSDLKVIHAHMNWVRIHLRNCYSACMAGDGEGAIEMLKRASCAMEVVDVALDVPSPVIPEDVPRITREIGEMLNG